MKFIKNNFKVIIGFIIGLILASSITVYATSYFAKDISYTRDGTDINNVQDALNNLYEKYNTSFTGSFYLAGSTQANYSETSYTEIDVKNYTKVNFTVSKPCPNDATSYIMGDSEIIRYVTSESENFELDISNYSKLKIYHQQNNGYMYLSGTYTLSN